MNTHVYCKVEIPPRTHEIPPYEGRPARLGTNGLQTMSVRGSLVPSCSAKLLVRFSEF